VKPNLPTKKKKILISQVNQEKPKSIEIHKILHLLACKQVESEQATHPKRRRKNTKKSKPWHKPQGETQVNST
jgi:hypothetical protein